MSEEKKDLTGLASWVPFVDPLKLKALRAEVAEVPTTLREMAAEWAKSHPFEASFKHVNTWDETARTEREFHLLRVLTYLLTQGEYGRAPETTDGEGELRETVLALAELYK